MNIQKVNDYDFDISGAHVNTTFTPAEHQFIAMKLSYQAEEIVRETDIHTINDQLNLRQLIQDSYRKNLNDDSIILLPDVPQFTNEKIALSGRIQGFTIDAEMVNGFHANAIARGNPNRSNGEIAITLTGTNFSEAADAIQTISNNGEHRVIDYSELAKQYVEEVRKKYPSTKIVINGHSLGGKLAIQIGLLFPDIEIFAFNPTAIDKRYIHYLKQQDHFDNINVLVYEDDIAGLERWFRYIQAWQFQRDLPFNLYYMDATKAGFPNGMKVDIPSPINGSIDGHSQGGFQGVDGSLWDIFNLNPIQFSDSITGTQKIVFDKKRYTSFAKLLNETISTNLKIARTLLEQLEDEIHENIQQLIHQAEDEINRIKIDYDALGAYSDPRFSRMETFKDKYFIDHKYRCYQPGKLDELIHSLNDTNQQVYKVAEKILQSTDNFEKEEYYLAKLFRPI
ncbi:lipase family protein [Caldibacillus lycopersici]|uniref:Lipase family protein n=1 Tax=Perspicuibacillus lycopersici TaxID=1325689 RepID=A0AAE3LPX4_9BACI|nr:lipase family protein [Perspicuibacillus lycopersici]MCU9612789.1 lipase family protein [Perspicuibacillus lycopersici]